MSQLRVCKRCVMDTSDPAIQFDANGICNHCNYHEHLKKNRILPAAENVDELIQRIKKRGQAYAYDCAAGISGGTDSSYMLHQLKNFGLRVLAVHYDSGWNSEEAVSNIQLLTQKMGLDLYKFSVDWEEFKALQLAYLKAGVIDLDVPTDHALHGALYKAAADHRVPFIITGHNMATESIMPASWVTDKLDSSNLLDIYQQYGSDVPLKTFPLQTLARKFYNYNIRKLEMVFMLNYIRYNKPEAAEILQKTYDWAPVRVKHGESIWTRFFQCHILPRRFGVDKRKAHFSNLIISGVMTREEALAELKLPIYKDNFEADKAMILSRYGISEMEFENYMTQTIRQHSDFRTEKRIKDLYAKVRDVMPFKGMLNISTRHE
jgi:N-acetyl sugar amidotransferase